MNESFVAKNTKYIPENEHLQHFIKPKIQENKYQQIICFFDSTG